MKRFAIVLALVLSLILVAGAAFSQATDAKKPAADAKKSLGAKTIAQPCPVWVIGSYDKDGKPNVMTASWAAICCSNPPCVTVSLREATYTYGNINASQAFTVNIPSEQFAGQAAYYGSVSGRDTDKFAATKLTPVKSELVNAPYVAEFPLVLECKLVKTVPLGLHTMFIGEIVDVKADPDILNEQGSIDVLKLRPFIYAPGNPGFFGIGEPLGDMNELTKEFRKK